MLPTMSETWPALGAATHRPQPCRSRRARLRWLAVGPLLLAAVGCGGGGSSDSNDAITVYTCVSDETIQPVIKQFESDHPNTSVNLFRAPTGDLNARIAGDARSGGLKADVVWACDPLTMQGYVDQGLVGGWTPDDAATIPEKFRTDDYVGVALLYMLAIYHDGVEPPTSWSDLTKPVYGPVALPDPNIAASALGALGYFDQNPDYGMAFFEGLKKEGAAQLSTPDDVVNAVAQGTSPAGITIANSAYASMDAGSPIGIVWPQPGAVAIYGPVALAKDSADSTLAKDFISYVISEPGQQLIAKAGSYPTLPGVTGPELPADAPIVSPDWSTLSAKKDTLLGEYQQIFGG